MSGYLMRRFRELGVEERTLAVLLIASVFFHILVMVLSRQPWLTSAMPAIQEWEIQADLFVGADFTAPDKSALPNAIEADEAAIPKNMLPQLPKVVSIKDASEKAETDADEGDLAKTKDKSDKEVEKKEKDLALKMKNDANKMDQEEFVQRSALEKLKQEEKFSKKLQAEQKAALAKLKSDAAAANGLNSGSGGLSGSQLKLYQARMLAHVRRCYQLPQAYNLEKANLMVQLAVVLSDGGDLVSLKVQNPSGDKVFDDMAFKAVKDCAPLPTPPPAVAGKTWAFNFKP